MVARKGVGSGCHGDSNTPVALPTCLPGPNLLGEGGEEGTMGGREGSTGCRYAWKREGGGESEETREEGGKMSEEMEQTRIGLPVLYTYSLS